jgi:hypothetical protein
MINPSLFHQTPPPPISFTFRESNTSPSNGLRIARADQFSDCRIRTSSSPRAAAAAIPNGAPIPFQNLRNESVPVSHSKIRTSAKHFELKLSTSRM